MRQIVNFLALLLVSTIFLASCKDDPIEPTQSEFEILKTYLADNSLDLPAIANGYTKAGSSLNVNMTDFSIPDYYIIDLRAQADFDLGRIKDAHIATMATVLDEAAKAGGKKILVVCYTGQTAARAVAALRLMKYDAYSLKWGMCGWHDDLAGKWKTNAGDFASPNWLTSGTPKTLTTFSEPKITTNLTEGREILEARVKAMLTKDWTVSKTDVLANPANYFIVNKWPLASWDAFGHINGAFRIDEDLTLDHLNYLDPAANIVVYCYTGQTSGITGFWLDVLGYNTRSINFGANGIVHTALKNGTVDGSPSKTWRGAGSGSELNFGYYDATGNLHGPK